MRETVYIRDGKKLIDKREKIDAPGRVENLKTINAAKRKSRRLQQLNGGLGRGYVQRA